MKNTQDKISGRRFGRLTTLKLVIKFESGRNRPIWLCHCDCGVEKEIHQSALLRGTTISCGCWRRDHPWGVKHHMYKAPEYKIWCAMKQRCLNPGAPAWKNYGGRGVAICERWMKFENFISDMGRRPTSKHSVERLDNNGGYEPSNCRWATWTAQANNKRTNRKLTHNGETLTLAQWSIRTGVSAANIRTRLQLGWSAMAALSEPLVRGSRKRTLI